MEESTPTSNPTNPIRCIVKLGGAAITCKNQLEKINEENLRTVCSQLRQAMVTGSASKKVLGMDWSKRPGKPEISVDVDDFKNQDLLGPSNFVVVHGAGSFGHFQASRSGVHKGGLDQSLVKAGFVATRISNTTGCVPSWSSFSCLDIISEGIVSVGISPFSCGWTTSKRNLESADLLVVAESINTGFVPVLHGDAVLDKLQGCTILSGDVIIRHLAAYLKPEYVVFLVCGIFFVVGLLWIKTDVLGVYDRPPSEPDALLLREIAVREDGRWTVVEPKLQNSDEQVEITVAAHDTTGGMVTKISEAAMIAKLGIDVYIVKAATSHSMRALNGEVSCAIPEDWLGTVIRFVGTA